MFQSINPATEIPIQSYPLLSDAELQSCLSQSLEAWQTWRNSSFAERSQALNQAAAYLRQNLEDLAQLMTAEMGKPLAQSRGEIEKCAWVCAYYAENGPGFLTPEPVATEAQKSYVTFQPLGPILAIMPWNFPFWQVFRFAAPNLMAGNTVLLKHAENVGGCAQAIETLFKTCLPPHVFQNLFIDLQQVENVIQAPEVMGVTLTGSVRAGRSVASQAGAALKKSVLELGGSDPYIVLADADLDLAVQACSFSRLLNGGQTCISAKRFIVEASIYEAFEAKLVAAFQNYRMGDPLEEGVQLGPLARTDLRQNLIQQVESSLAQGAKCLVGGQIPEGPGYFYPPTLLTEIRPGMPAWDEELFGPVGVIIPVQDATEAVAIANQTPYGLGAAVFTQNQALGESLAAEHLEAGACFVNDFVKSDPRLPFGGIKASGYGRELGVYGIKEFMNIKTVYLK